MSLIWQQHDDVGSAQLVAECAHAAAPSPLLWAKLLRALRKTACTVTLPNSPEPQRLCASVVGRRLSVHLVHQQASSDRRDRHRVRQGSWRDHRGIMAAVREHT
jgi:hypothetical protein